MKESEITLAEMFRVTNYLPENWELRLLMWKDEASFALSAPEGEDVEVYDTESTGEMLLAYVNEARASENMKPIDWNGVEHD